MAAQVVGLAQYEAEGENVGLVRALGALPNLRRQVVDVRLQHWALVSPAELLAFSLVLATRGQWACFNRG